MVSDFSRLSKTELESYCQKLRGQVRELEDLVQVIAKGKYTWEATFDAITEPVMIVSRDYKVERANLAIAKLSKTDITQVINQTCYEVFAKRNEPCQGCTLLNSIDQNERGAAPLGCKIAARDLIAHSYPFIGDSGECNSAVMYYHDVTEELRLKQEVIQQEKMAAIGMLAGGVAHEINNPLGGILAFTQLLLQQDNDEGMTEDLKEIEAAALRCKNIVKDLLDFSRVSKDKEKSSVNINDLLKKVVPFVRLEMRSLNVELELNLSKELPLAIVIGDRLQQVFLNLMTNASHAMPKGGVLKIATFYNKKAGEIEITFCDTGTGIPKEIQSRIFEPFFTTKEVGKGTGLGLAICYRIIGELGGHIHLESEQGKGTTFLIRLPVNECEK